MTPLQSLIPLPRRIEEYSGALVVPHAVALQLENLDADHAELLARLGRLLFGERLANNAPDALQLVVMFDDNATSEAPELLRGEGYELVVRDGIVLRAKYFAGLQRGLQTVKQLLEIGDDTGHIPSCRIEDWPRLAQRGLHYDFAREMHYRHQHIKSVLSRIAGWKMNTFHLYLEDMFEFPGAPDIRREGAMTVEEARDLKALAKVLGIELVPQIPTLGHMEKLLHGAYEELRE